MKRAALIALTLIAALIAGCAWLTYAWLAWKAVSA